jgi:hypothetical protein
MACYGDSGLSLNYVRMRNQMRPANPKAWEQYDATIIHELAHDIEDNHLSEAYYDACCLLGARLKRLAGQLPVWKP